MLFMDALIIGFDLSVIIGFSERLRNRLMRFNASFRALVIRLSSNYDLCDFIGSKFVSVDSS